MFNPWSATARTASLQLPAYLVKWKPLLIVLHNFSQWAGQMVEEVQYESPDYLQLVYEKDVPFSDPISRNKLLISLNTSRNDSRSRHFQGGMMPNTRGTTLHLLLWVVQSPPLHLYNKFDGTAESSQLISLAAAFPSPFADWLSFFQAAWSGTAVQWVLPVTGKICSIWFIIFPFGFLMRKAQRDEMISFLQLGVMNTWLQ